MRTIVAIVAAEREWAVDAVCDHLKWMGLNVVIKKVLGFEEVLPNMDTLSEASLLLVDPDLPDPLAGHSAGISLIRRLRRDGSAIPRSVPIVLLVSVRMDWDALPKLDHLTNNLNNVYVPTGFAQIGHQMEVLLAK